ncbi:PLCH1 phosphodiesterase, partial [Amia calva]|nr:PLCH1 phosphodiesterase [Amia calva]
QIIDPYVEVEIIGLPVDCCKEQTRVVDDNGFNPVWEETLTFTLHMPELALVRFLVWDHDPIGRDFVGQRTVAFCSLMPGYRHVYLEGMTESSIFIQVMVNDIYGKGRQLRGIKGLFNKNPKNGSVDTNSGFQIRKRSISDHILRRTASAPAKGRKKTKMGFAEPQCERKDSEPELESKNAMESHRPKSSLHRPVSMPLEKLLTGVLELPTNETEKVSEDNDTHSGNLSSETGRLCSVERLRSVSVDLLFETYPSLQSEDRMLSSKAPWESSLRVPVKTSEMEKVSYLEIGGKSSEECFDAPPPNEENVSFDEEVFNDDSSCKKTIWSQPNIPETTPEHLVSTKDGPEDHKLQSPYKSMQESTISRLIDNVSLDNENDTCGSISALIGQFDTTHDQSNLTVVSSIQGTNNHTFSIMSGFSSTLIWEPNTPQKPCLPSKTSKDAFLDATSDTAVFSSPETTDQSVYTILNEDFLSPTSVYNLRDQTIRSMQINSEENTPVGSSCTTPLKSFSPRLRSDERAGWGPQGICSSTDRTTSDKFLVFPDSASSSLMEVEVNVDDDSQDITLTSTCANNQWTSQSPSPCSDSPHDWPLNNKSIRTKRINRFQGDYHLSKHFDPRKTHSVFERNDYTPNSDCNVPNNCIDYNGLAAPNARCQGLPLPNRPARHLYTHPEQAPPAVHVAKHPSPGKSKSLGDLTSEDISCNFESKYKYISRSFITPNMRERKRMSSLTNRPQSADPLTEQLRRLVSFEPDECSQPGPVSPLRQDDDSPKILSRKLSSRSQSRVRHIANRAKERQEASKQKVPDSCSTAGVVLRNKPSAQNPTVNRHSTGSYIAGYLNHINGAGMEDRGLPEGACTSLHYNYNDHFYTDDSVLQTDSGPRSEPEIYFLLRL